MKAKSLLAAICFSLASGALLAQHPLVGTWEMVSVKGINAEGERFFIDTTTAREVKIITPTHYMLIACDVSGDSLQFNRTMAGTVKLEGDHYYENPTHASVQIFPNLKVDFRWKLRDGNFIQSGTIVRPDGKVITLEELIFRKVENAKAEPKNPAIGAWLQESGFYEEPGKKKAPTFASSDARLLLVTPSHWMRMDLKNNKFHQALYGTYSLSGDQIETTIDYASSPYFKKGSTRNFSQKVKGSTVYTVRKEVTTDGKTATFEDAYKKAP
jgi:hypothetical protein